MKEGTTLKDRLDELNYILLELHDIYVKLQDEDHTMILLASLLPSLLPSYNNFVSCCFIVGDILL